MKFCQPHWDALRDAIEARGLSDLIAPDGETAAMQMVDALKREETTAANFDPLMNAHFAIASNVMGIMSSAGANPLYLMADDEVAPEDPVTGYGKEHEEKTWPRCPLCYLNLAHEVSCTDKRCKLDKKAGYDFFIDKAADDQVTAWEAVKSQGS